MGSVASRVRAVYDEGSMPRLFLICVSLIVAASLCRSQGAPSASAPPIPPLQKIVEQTLARNDAQHQRLQSMEYDQTASIDQLDDQDRSTHRDVLQMIIRPGANPSMQVTSTTGGGHPPSAPEQAAAQAKARDVEDNKRTFSLRALVDRFDLSLAGEDRSTGDLAYIIAFTPKPVQAYRDETEKVVDQLQGRMWISSRTYDVLRTNAALAHPVSVAWFLATIPQLEFHYRAQDIPSGFGPCSVEITLRIQSLFLRLHEKQSVEMKNFRPRS
jgi:hypothetical protein